MLLIRLMCHTPIVIRLGQLNPFFNDLMMKYTPKIWVGMSDWCLLEQVLAQMEAFSGFYDSPVPPSLGNVCGLVPGQQSQYILHCCFVCCCPGNHWDNMEQVVAWWWHPVASRIALDMLHWVMHSILLQCIQVTIEMAQDRGTFVPRRHLFWLL